MVEHLKVMAALTVEPAYAFNLLIGWGGYGRAPPDLMVEREIDGGQSSPYRSSPLDGGLNSRAPKGPYGRAP